MFYNKIYDENDWKNICMFRSNIKAYDHLSLIKKVKAQEYNDIGWYAHWWVNSSSDTTGQWPLTRQWPLVSSLLLLGRIARRKQRNSCDDITDGRVLCRRCWNWPNLIGSWSHPITWHTTINWSLLISPAILSLNHCHLADRSAAEHSGPDYDSNSRTKPDKTRSQEVLSFSRLFINWTNCLWESNSWENPWNPTVVLSLIELFSWKCWWVPNSGNYGMHPTVLRWVWRSSSEAFTHESDFECLFCLKFSK